MVTHRARNDIPGFDGWSLALVWSQNFPSCRWSDALVEVNLVQVLDSAETDKRYILVIKKASYRKTLCQNLASGFWKTKEQVDAWHGSGTGNLGQTLPFHAVSVHRNSCGNHLLSTQLSLCFVKHFNCQVLTYSSATTAAAAITSLLLSVPEVNYLRAGPCVCPGIQHHLVVGLRTMVYFLRTHIPGWGHLQQRCGDSNSHLVLFAMRGRFGFWESLGVILQMVFAARITTVTWVIHHLGSRQDRIRKVLPLHCSLLDVRKPISGSFKAARAAQNLRTLIWSLPLRMEAQQKR